MENNVIINLEDLEDIMGSLPDNPGEKRKNALTKDDVLIIARIVKALAHQQCGRFTNDEVTTVKKHIGYFNKTANAIGTAFLFIIASSVAVIVTKGFWVALAEKITKQGGH